MRRTNRKYHIKRSNGPLARAIQELGQQRGGVGEEDTGGKTVETRVLQSVPEGEREKVSLCVGGSGVARRGSLPLDTHHSPQHRTALGQLQLLHRRRSHDPVTSPASPTEELLARLEVRRASGGNMAALSRLMHNMLTIREHRSLSSSQVSLQVTQHNHITNTAFGTHI